MAARFLSADNYSQSNSEGKLKKKKKLILYIQFLVLKTVFHNFFLCLQVHVLHSHKLCDAQKHKGPPLSLSNLLCFRHPQENNRPKHLVPFSISTSATSTAGLGHPKLLAKARHIHIISNPHLSGVPLTSTWRQRPVQTLFPPAHQVLFCPITTPSVPSTTHYWGSFTRTEIHI